MGGILVLLGVLALPVQDDERLPWTSIDEALTQAAAKQLPIICYVYDDASDGMPKSYRLPQIIAEFGDKFAWAKMAFNRDNRLLAMGSIKDAPVLLGMDTYGNIVRRGRFDPEEDQLRSFLKATASNAAKNAETIAARWEKLKADADSDKARNNLIRELIKFTLEVAGYPEVREAEALIPALGKEDMARVEGEDPKVAIKALEDLLRRYRDTPVYNTVQLKLATVHHGTGDVRRAFGILKRLDRTKDPDLRARLDEMKAQFISAGRKKALDTLQQGLDGETETARETLNQMKKEYSGTEVADTLTRVLDALDR